MPYEVRLAQFEGPLDLLLHLIRKNEIDIYDIPIAAITEQYLQYLDELERWSLDVASEFLVMAATLLSIKSRMLLPRRATAEAEEEDPRLPLVQQLLEYERCKWAAAQLAQRAAENAQVYGREPMDLRAYRVERRIDGLDVSLWDLVNAFRKLYLRLPPSERVAEIRGKVEKVEEWMDEIAARMRRYRSAEFGWLLSGERSRGALVAAFLAILELLKDGRLACRQAEPFGPIELVWMGD
ncbi:segregation and condensation protein A [Alicyclobacillus vulcanalis]|uniref:Segregation and condensation protein A n=1 Tax=Alicyclobacillus vulcanalis TaxID=252246 RepID=A0A1N7KL36_9BACL|nr:segregation/condensation protein A [Alicyclobacillus vulcanalis]SIS62293.1 condensin subunit ScpA [Alicyclobacillus vulcanalis]